MRPDQEIPAAEELAGAVSKFLERAAAATERRKMSRAVDYYRRALRKRFHRQQRHFFETVLPCIQGYVAAHVNESLRNPKTLWLGEAGEDDYQNPEVADALEAAARLLRRMDDLAEDQTISAELDAAMRLALLTGAEQVLIEIAPEVGIKFGLDNARALQFLLDHAFARVGRDLDSTTKDLLKTTLIDAFKERLSYTEIARRLRQKWTEMTRKRAEVIAVTEIGNAYSEGTLAAALELKRYGLAVEKAWLTAGDLRVDPHCQANEAAGWIAADETFPSGADRPLDHPNCRCALLTRRAKRKPEDSPDPETVAS